MALFPHLGPLRPNRRRQSFAGTCSSRRALLAVPLVVLLGFVGVTYFGAVDILAQKHVPPLRITSYLKDAPSSSSSSSSPSPSSPSPSDPLAPVDSSPDADHASPFSFDLDRIVSGANASFYADWMAAAPDHASLADLAIPGTHDTMTHRIDLVGFRCQNTPLAEQLRAGLRYLDIRARLQIPPGDTDADGPYPLGIYHSNAYTGYDLADVAQTVFAFLDDHPAETVVLRLKEEGLPINGSVHDPPGRAPDDGTAPSLPSTSGSPFMDAFQHYLWRDARTAAGFAAHLYGYVGGDAGADASAAPPTQIPTMGQLRGKVLLLQEFPYFPAAHRYTAPGTPLYGIPWQLSSALLAVEDKWQIPDLAHLDDKWAAVRHSLQAAASQASESESAASSSTTPKLFLSHLSASVGVLPIDAAAGPMNRSVEGINDRTGRWLEQGDDLAERGEKEKGGKADGRAGSPVGILMADFPGARLVDAILRRNAFLKFEEQP